MIALVSMWWPTHFKQDFVETNITGTLALLEESVAARVGAFIGHEVAHMNVARHA